jgi:hypothetical protein
MSNNQIRTEKTKPSQSTTITNDQLSMLSIQFESIARYFKTRLFDNSVSMDIQKRVCKLNKVGYIAKLSQTQYNNTMHYLQNIENVMHQYYWCVSLIEDNLFSSLLAREIDNTTVVYSPNKLSIENNHLTRVKNLSEELINLKVLKELY